MDRARNYPLIPWVLDLHERLGSYQALSSSLLAGEIAIVPELRNMT
jgi:hypothetical protein